LLEIEPAISAALLTILTRQRWQEHCKPILAEAIMISMINARNLVVSLIGLTALVASGCGVLKKEQLEAMQQPQGADAIAGTIASLAPDFSYQRSVSTAAYRTQASNVARILFMIDGVASAFREDNLKLNAFLHDKETKKEPDNENALRNIPMGISLLGRKDFSTKELFWTYEINSTTYFAAVTSETGSTGLMTVPGIVAGGTEVSLAWSFSSQGTSRIKTITVTKGTSSQLTYKITLPADSPIASKIEVTALPASISATWNYKGGFVLVGGIKYCWTRDSMDNTVDDQACKVKF
jgi:hypothetical protein